MPTPVDIVEVTPRDGLQNEKQVLSTQAKVDLIIGLMDAGARRIEIASFVHPRKVPQMADAEAVCEQVPRRTGIDLIGLVLNRRGAERAVNARVDEINYVVPTTDEFGRHNQGVTTRQALDMLPDIAAQVRSAGKALSVTLAVAFGCPYEGSVPPRRVSDVVEAVMSSSPDEIALADTIGCAVPSDVKQRFESAASLTDAPLRAHFHDTRRTALANVYAAMQAGVRVFDSSTAGIGGCPFAPGAAGNVATEDLAWMLHTSDVVTTINIDAILRIGDSITKQLGIPSRSAIAGSGIFPPSSDRVAALGG